MGTLHDPYDWESRRITPERVRRALAATGAYLVRGQLWAACFWVGTPIGVLVAEKDPEAAKGRIGAVWAREILGLPECYTDGFMTGYHGEPNDADDPFGCFSEGYEDGVIVGRELPPMPYPMGLDAEVRLFKVRKYLERIEIS